MSDPERLLHRQPRDEVSALEQELLLRLEPTVHQKEQLLGSLMAQVTLTASAATATAALTSQAGASTGLQAAVSGTSVSASGAATSGAAVTLAPGPLAAGGLLSGLGLKATVAVFLAVPTLAAGSYFALTDSEKERPVARAVAQAPVEHPVQPDVLPEKEETATSAESPAPAQAEPGHAPKLGSAPARASASSLAVEDRLLRQARAKYKAGDHDGALSTLGILESRYPQGILVQEREVLRIAILKDQGQKSQANERVKTFREQYPDSPYEAPVSPKAR